MGNTLPMVEASAEPATVWTHQIYSGQILRFSSLPSMQRLADWSRDFCINHFYPHEPELIHEHYDTSELLAKVHDARVTYMRSTEVAHLMRSVFEESGLPIADIASDRMILRIQPPLLEAASEEQSVEVAPLTLHRDTWGSNLYAQVNWWAPIFPIDAGRTIAFFPKFWDTPLANNTAQFDLPRVIDLRKRNPGLLRATDVVPIALQDVDPTWAVPLLIDPGEIVAFSGQHAHSSVANSTARTRLSIDVRTISIEDVLRGRGAPNIDGVAPYIAFRLFRRLSDGKALGAVLGRHEFERYELPDS